MPDFVFKVAEKGTPVRRAADYQLALSSEWPVIPIYKQGYHEFDLEHPDGFEVVATHKLGYYPVFFIFHVTSTGTPTMYNGNGSFGMSVDEQKLYVHSLAAVPQIIPFYWCISYLPLVKDFDAPHNVLDAASGIPKSAFTARFALPGRSARSHSQLDFSLHSDTRPFMVQMIRPINIPDSVAGPDATTLYEATMQTPFNYYPINLLFAECGTDLAIDGTGRYRQAADPFLVGGTKPGSQLGSIDLSTVTLGDTGPRNWSVVVLKEPFLFGKTTEVVW